MAFHLVYVVFFRSQALVATSHARDVAILVGHLERNS